MPCALYAIPIESMVCSMGRTVVRTQLQERQWSKMEAALLGERGTGRPPKDERNFIDAVLSRRTGFPWRDLPEEFGPWKMVFNRIDRWSKSGKWTRPFGPT